MSCGIRRGDGCARFSGNALTVLGERYLRCDAQGVPAEDPAGMLHRVAAAVAAPAQSFGDDPGYWEDRFLQRLQQLEFLPNSPTLMNAGLPDGQLAACFVLPVEDDLDSIFAALRRMARIHQTGGGTGLCFSRLRPREDRVLGTGGITSGPLSFMEVFDHTTAVIRRGGRRRGANMGVLGIEHPDIEDFINAKRGSDRLQNFNLSVAVTDDFFEAWEKDRSFPLRNPRSGRVAREVSARRMLRLIAEAAWDVGDPGLIFIDEINRHNPTPGLGRIEATNPCGEQPLLPYESCVLGSVNLAALAVRDGLDWHRFRETIRDGIVFLDNVIEATCFPFPEIAEATRRTRKVGLGVMGLADLFARIGIAYDSPEGVALGERIAAFLAREARAASGELGERRGSFPVFADSDWPKRGASAMRNATTTCVAPTGTLSLLAGTSGGIEPFFALAMKREVLGGRRLTEVNPVLERELSSLEAPALAKEALDVVRQRGSVRDVGGLPASLRRRFPVALQIAPEVHVRMQAAFQSHVDAAVSKTVNLPADTPVSAVEQVFLLARRLRLKGITVYRYGTRPGQTLSLVADEALPDCRECAV
jgi:ribonucleoside-diphosphate reductase alpha chain